MTLIAKAAILAATALGLPVLVGHIEAGKPGDIVVSDRLQSDFCRLIAESGPNQAGRCTGGAQRWGADEDR